MTETEIADFHAHIYFDRPSWSRRRTWPRPSSNGSVSPWVIFTLARSVPIRAARFS